jgi:hypothetical protein
MLDTWVATDRRLGGPLDEQGNPTPLLPAQIESLQAQLGAVADGILAAIQQETPSAGAPWFWETFVGTGLTFTLARVPISNTLTVYRNGLLELGWALSARTLTLATERLSNDDDLRVHYQAIVPL